MAFAFWFELQVDGLADQWDFHPVRCRNGYNSNKGQVGEKWDQILLKDVDQNGNLNEIGNDEEHYTRNSLKDELPQAYLTVAWFENPLK